MGVAPVPRSARAPEPPGTGPVVGDRDRPATGAWRGRLRRLGAGRTFEALHVRDFRVLWSGFMGMWLSIQFMQVARGYLAYRLTGSALAIGLVTLALGLPRIVLSPVGGWLADRCQKRTVLSWTSVVLAASGMATAALQVAGVLDVPWLIGLGLVQGSAFGLAMPARQAYVPVVVGGGHLLPNAISLNTAGMNLTRMVGPALAGLLIATPFVGLAGVFFLTGTCYLWVWWSVFRVQDPGAPVAAPQRMGSSIRAGFSYVRRSPALLALMSLGFVPLALGMPYINLMPAVAAGPLRGGAPLLGLLLSIGGVGSLCGTLTVASLARYPRKATLQLALGVGFGISLLGFAFFVRRDELPLAVPFLFTTGLCGDAYMALNSSLIMMSTDAAMYGRVMGVYMTTQSIRPITVLPISALADAVGTPATLLGAGALVAAFVASVAGLYPGYRRIGTEAPAPATPPPPDPSRALAPSAPGLPSGPGLPGAPGLPSAPGLPGAPGLLVPHAAEERHR